MYQSLPAGGRGAKVGIIDLFDLTVLSAAAKSQDLPTIPAAQRACWWQGSPCTFGTPGVRHGIAVAEAIADIAPNATLYLAEAGTITDYRKAVDWFAANGVTIVNHSGTAPYDGPGNGTGPAAALVDYAVSKGMLWINAAGNAAADPQYPAYRGGYWRARWNDPDNDGWMNFTASDESLGAYCGALMGLRWSDWGSAKTDYDLWVSDFNPRNGINTTRRLLSGRSQAAGAAPLEGNDFRWLCNHDAAAGPVYDANNDNFVSLYVQRTTRTTQSPVGDVLEIMVNGGWFEHSVSSGSAAVPFADSKNIGALSIGAITGDQPYYVAGYSAHGPTNDGRRKPDFVAPTCYETFAYGSKSDDTCTTAGFAGTSAAAPQVAGLAANLIGEYGVGRPLGLRLFLESRLSSFEVVGAPHAVGLGRIHGVGATPAATWQQAGQFLPLSPTRVFDTRASSGPIGIARPGPLAANSLTPILLETDYDQAFAYVVNVTILGQPTAGYTQIFSGDAIPGATSHVNNDKPNQIISNLVVTSFRGGLSVYTSSGGHVIVDLIGKFVEENYDDGSGRFTSAAATEVLNTSTCVGVNDCTAPQLAGAKSEFVLSAASAGAPSGAEAAMVSVTASDAASVGYVSVVEANATIPYRTSTLNVDPSTDRSGLAFVPLDANGEFKVFTSAQTQLKVDVLGWFSGPQPLTEVGMFVAARPTRIRDTRVPSGAPPLAAGVELNIPVVGVNGIPKRGVGPLLVNVTVTKSVDAGSVRVVNAGVLRSDVAVTASRAGQSIASATVASPVGGKITLRASMGTHLIVDIAGRFVAAEELKPGQLVELVIPGSEEFTPAAVMSSRDGGIVALQGSGPQQSPPFVTHVWTRATNELRKVAIPTGHQLTGLSGDGRFLLTSTGTRFFVYNLATSEMEQVTVDSAEVPLTVPSRTASISHDGNLVAFVTTAKLSPADIDTTADVYLRNRAAGTTTFVGVVNNVGTNEQHLTARLSPDGTHLVILHGTPSSNVNEYPAFRIDRVRVADGVRTSRALPELSAVHAISGISENGSHVIAGVRRGYGSEEQLRINPATGSMTYLRNYGNRQRNPVALRFDGSVAAYEEASIIDQSWFESRESAGIYVHNFTTGDVRNVSLLADGTRPTGLLSVGPDMPNPAMSLDGRYVFTVERDRAAAPGVNGPKRLYIFDLSLG